MRVRPPFSDVPGPFAPRRRIDTSMGDVATSEQDRGMRAFWWDGFFANVPETLLVSYLGLYVVAFGGSKAQVGVATAAASLFAALAFFPGAWLVEKYGRRKLIVLATGGGLARVALLGLVFVPFVAEGNAAIWLVIALVSVRGFLGYFALPAWTSMTADVVPIGIRGRYFASRNFGMSIAALVTLPLAGLALDRFGGLEGWQVVWLGAGVAAALSTWAFALIPDVRPAHAEGTAPVAAPRGGVLAELLSDRNMAMYLLGTAMFSVALTAAGPFFNVYLKQDLDASGLWVGALNAIPAITGLAGLLYFGRLMDVRGTKWMLVTFGLLLPILPAAWLVVTQPWHVVPINVAGGVLWAGYQLAVLNMTMVMAPPESRARYAAAFHMVVFASSFAGPLLGGALIGAVGYKFVFGFSAIGRLAGTLVVWRFVPGSFELRGAGTAAAA
jgi:MFS family permease